MEHLYFFYFLVTFSIGVLSLGIVITAAIKTRKAFVLSYLMFYLAFSLVIVAEMVQAYIHANISQSAVALALLCESLASLGIYLLIIIVPACTHMLCSSAWLQWRNGLFVALAFSIFALSQLANATDVLLFEQPESLLLLPVILYSVLYGVRCYPTISPPTHKLFAKKWLILLGVTCALLGVELFSGGIEQITVSQDTALLVMGQGIVLYPIVYGSFSVLFAWYFLKHYLLPAPQISQEQATLQAAPSNEGVTIERLCEPYHLSPREKEVLLLVLQGYSNAQIKDALYISLGTVKAHISKIFQKIGVKRRYELLTLFRETPLPPPQKNPTHKFPISTHHPPY